MYISKDVRGASFGAYKDLLIDAKNNVDKILKFLIYGAHQMMTDHGHCVTPYILNNEPSCLTKENATTSLLFARKFQDSSSYSLPCNLVNTELLLESFTTIPGSEENITFILNFPTTVRTTSATYSYTFLSFIAEVASWVGLFTGVALIQVGINIYNDYG